jgi:hypothetical protein
VAPGSDLDESFAEMNNIGREEKNATGDLSLENAPGFCCTCGQPLCLRKQVINMALGNTDEMFCLVCLGRIDGREPKDVLVVAKDYIRGRPCFNKQWSKYENGDYCPDRLGCFFKECFGD